MMTSPDMMFLVHERVHKYCKLMAHRSPHAIALRVQIPGVLEFAFVNQHGPFTLREREALDALIASVSNVGNVGIGGDFNDGIWHASSRQYARSRPPHLPPPPTCPPPPTPTLPPPLHPPLPPSALCPRRAGASVHNLLMQFFTLDSSKIEVLKLVFLILWSPKMTIQGM